MKLSAILLAAVLGMPVYGQGENGAGEGGSVCGAGLIYTLAQCCKAQAFDLADVDCKPPREPPSSLESFKALCASEDEIPLL
ncbi:hypothetical protein Asppvi_009500 [Aspergillus pseudoviridinutans]|uniref:Uncharacterized protein n=1 Tax=Aspergillus pseudoviridinutans TaxID=1517512 RepID=A0A9P3BLJ5_9EURO|nr:uncharacterized protein Asppvi_009500 [Aspergillus pseudoviridinutans]GIJ90543.1 hypothetical protein Asppvi_009500 [Aspergillus pseudoviridinutans]